MSGSKQTTTQNTNQQQQTSQTQNSSNTNTQSSGASPFAEAALPGYESAFNGAQGALSTLGNMPTVANTGNANYVADFAEQQGQALEAPIGQAITQGGNYVNNLLANGLDLNNPALQDVISRIQANNQTDMQKAIDLTRDRLSLSGAYGGTGATDTLVGVTDEYNKNFLDNQAGIYYDWIGNQQQQINNAPNLMAQFASLGAIPDQLQQPAFDARQANDQDELDFTRQQASIPLALQNNFENYFRGLSSAPVSQTQTDTSSSTSTGTGTSNGTSTQTQTQKPGTLQTIMGVGSLAASLAGAASGNPMALMGLMGGGMKSPEGMNFTPSVPQYSGPLAFDPFKQIQPLGV